MDCTSSGGHRRDRRCLPVDISNVEFPTDSGNVTVGNPKDIITNALPAVGNLSATILAQQLELVTGEWYSLTDDLIQVS